MYHEDIKIKTYILIISLKKFLSVILREKKIPWYNLFYTMEIRFYLNQTYVHTMNGYGLVALS